MAKDAADHIAWWRGIDDNDRRRHDVAAECRGCCDRAAVVEHIGLRVAVSRIETAR